MKKKIPKKTPKKTKAARSRSSTPTPIVVETESNLTEEEQLENPLNRMPEGFKTADQVTEVDDLNFEIRRLRDLLTAFTLETEFVLPVDAINRNGKILTMHVKVAVDPLNQKIEIFPLRW